MSAMSSFEFTLTHKDGRVEKWNDSTFFAWGAKVLWNPLAIDTKHPHGCHRLDEYVEQLRSPTVNPDYKDVVSIRVRWHGFVNHQDPTKQNDFMLDKNRW